MLLLPVLGPKDKKQLEQEMFCYSYNLGSYEF